jgi:hypothetical protein
MWRKLGYLEKNTDIPQVTTVQKLSLSANDIGCEGLRHILQLLEENNVITDLVSSIVFRHFVHGEVYSTHHYVI